ncbi:MATE family efflux transporter [Candidatus Poribacteria bacterium]
MSERGVKTRRRHATLFPILATAIPAIIDLLCQPAIWLADKIFVGHMGEESPAALTAVGSSSQIILLTLTILLTTLIGTIIIILRYMGAGNYEEANHYSAQSLLGSLSLGVGIGGIWYLGAGPIFRQFFDAPPDVSELGIQYLRILAPFCPIIVINFMATGLLRFSGDTIKSMCTNVTVVAINLLGDYALIFGHWGLPKMGVAGAAWASGIGNSVGLIVSLSFLFSGRAMIKLSLRHFTDFRISTLRRIMGKGIPVTTEQLITTGANIVVVRYSMRLGDLAAAAAHQAIISFSWISIMFYLGLGTAATMLTGKRLGANDEHMAERAGNVASKISICFGVAFGALLFFCSRSIMRLFLPNNFQAIEIGSRCLKVVAVMQIPKAISIVFSSSLRGAGDVRWLVFVNIVGVLIGELTLARILGLGMFMTSRLMAPSLRGIWLGVGIGEAIRAGMNFHRYQRGGWKKIKI